MHAVHWEKQKARHFGDESKNEARGLYLDGRGADGSPRIICNLSASAAGPRYESLAKTEKGGRDA